MEEKYHHTIFSTFKKYHFVVILEIYYLYMFGPLNLDYVCGTLVCWQIIIIDLQFIESSLYNNCVALNCCGKSVIVMFSVFYWLFLVILQLRAVSKATLSSMQYMWCFWLLQYEVIPDNSIAMRSYKFSMACITKSYYEKINVKLGFL